MRVALRLVFIGCPRHLSLKWGVVHWRNTHDPSSPPSSARLPSQSGSISFQSLPQPRAALAGVANPWALGISPVGCLHSTQSDTT